MVEVNVGLKLSSVNLTSIEDFPTLLSPIRSNLNRTSYLVPMMELNQLVANRPSRSPQSRGGAGAWGVSNKRRGR